MFYRIAVLHVVALLTLAACAPAPDAGSAETASDFPEHITFNEHIAPIIHQNCAPCHRPNEAGPFSLLSYTDVRKRSKMIREVTQSGYMPPWPADRSYRSFAGERGLTEREKTIIARWVAQGMDEGEHMPPALPNFDAKRPLGAADAMVPFKDTVHIAGNNQDLFLYIKVPFEFERDTFVRALEFVPGNRRLVHHMNGSLINYAPGKKTDHWQGATIVNPDTTATFSAYRHMQLANDDGSFPSLTPSAVNYLPGVEAAAYPEGIGGFHISRKGALLIKTMHYGPSAIDTFDVSSIRLYFAPTPPKRPLLEIQMGTLGETPVVPKFVIPADSIVRFSTRYQVKEDLSLLTINPHMHLLGTAFKAYALTPQRDTIPLIYIPQWDFRWQYFYTFKHMLKIPKGSIIHAEATFDNTAENPQQPFLPPRTITTPLGDMKTTDEMFQFFINYVPYENGDESISLEP